MIDSTLSLAIGVGLTLALVVVTSYYQGRDEELRREIRWLRKALAKKK